MIRPLAVALASALILLSGHVAGAPSSTLRKIADADRIVVGYRESSIPFSYLISPTKPVGFAVELTEAIIDDVRKHTRRPFLKVEWMAVTGQTRIPWLVEGRYDLECGSTTNTAERGRQVAFAISHFYAGTRLLTAATGGVRGFDDLSGKTVATIRGSTNERALLDHVQARGTSVTVLPAADYGDTLRQLQAGRVAAVALDDVLLFGLRAQSSDPDALAVVGETLRVEPYGCMVRRDDPAFKRLVDATMMRLMRSGEFERLYAKWFESPIPPSGANLRMPMSPRLKANLRERSDAPAF